MLFKNALRVLAENFKNVYKFALYKIVLSLLAISLCTAILYPQLSGIFSSSEMVKFSSDIKDFFGAFFSVNADKLEMAKQSLLQEDGSLQMLLSLIASKSTGIIVACIGCVIVYFIGKFFDSLGCFAIGVSLNDKMSAYAETGFFGGLFTRFGRACKFAILYASVSFGFELACLAVLIFLLSACKSALVAVFLSITLIVLLQTLKMTIAGNWLPAMVSDDETLPTSMHKVNKRRYFFWKMFSTYLVACYTVLILNVSSAVFTFGSALLLTLPISFMLFICVQFVSYYTVCGKKYFVSFNSIETNPDKGDREHIFSYIDTKEIGNVTPLSKEDNDEDNKKE